MFSLRKYLRTQRAAKIITIILFLAVLFAVASGVYYFFRWEFSAIAHDAYLRVALPLYFYENLFLVVFMLVFVSSFISGMFALFRGAHDAFVMASPRFTMVFWRAYRRTFLSSLWPVVVILIPAFLGSSAVFPVSLAGGALFLLSIACLAGIAVALALALLIVCACALYLLQRFFLKYFDVDGLFGFGKSAVLGVLVIAAGFVAVWRRAWTGDVVSLFAPTNATWAASRLDVVLTRFSAFPTHLATLSLWNAQMGSPGSAFIASIGLAAICALCLLIMRVTQPAFLTLWQLFQEGSFQAKTSVAERAGGAGQGGGRGPVAFPRFFKSPRGAIFEKEGLMLFREMRSALWFFFLFLLWMVQLVLEFFVRENLVRHSTDLGAVVASVEALQLATAVYFVSAFILRFVFPAFSSERRTAWILGTAPLRMRSVFWGKFFFYALVFLCLGAVFCGVNFFVLQMALAQAAAFFIFVFLMIVFLVAFGLGLGAMFPNFDSDDPEVLSTTLPGLGFTFGSLLYGGVGTYVFYQFLSHGAAAFLVGFNVLTIALTVLLLFLALRALDSFEFTKEYS